MAKMAISDTFSHLLGQANEEKQALSTEGFTIVMKIGSRLVASTSSRSSGVASGVLFMPISRNSGPREIRWGSGPHR